MSAYKMFLPVMPNGTVMDMFPLRSVEAALVAAARFLPEAIGAAELRKSPALAPLCWRASGGGWGFSDELAVEMAKAFGYTATEVYLQSEARLKLPKVQVADIQWALNIAASKAVTMSAMEACQRIKKFLAEIDAVECVEGK